MLAKKRGALGEDIAACFLELQGCTVLQRNVRHADVEIDLVAREHACLLLVEVKLRAGATIPASAGVRFAQERRLLRAAAALLSRHQWADHVRLDLVAIDLDTSGRRLVVEHLRGVLPR